MGSLPKKEPESFASLSVSYFTENAETSKDKENTPESSIINSKYLSLRGSEELKELHL